MSSVSELHTDIAQPFCVEYDLYFKHRKHKKNTNELVLNINFYVEEIDITLGRLRVGLSEGRLKLDINQGEMPLASRELKNTLETEITLKVTQRTQDHHSQDSQSSNTGKLSHKPEFSAGTIQSQKDDTGQEETQEFTLKKALVTHGGQSNSPFWQFRTQISDTPIEGGLFNQNLGKVNAFNVPCIIKGSISYTQRHLWVSGIEGIWPTQMHVNNQTVRKILIWKFLSKHLCLKTLELKIDNES